MNHRSSFTVWFTDQEKFPFFFSIIYRITNARSFLCFLWAPSVREVPYSRNILWFNSRRFSRSYLLTVCYQRILPWFKGDLSCHPAVIFLLFSCYSRKRDNSRFLYFLELLLHHSLGLSSGNHSRVTLIAESQSWDYSQRIEGEIILLSSRPVTREWRKHWPIATR